MAAPTLFNDDLLGYLKGQAPAAPVQPSLIDPRFQAAISGPPTPVQPPPAQASAYQPTIREKLSVAIAGDAKQGSVRRDLTDDLMGTRGDGSMGLIDYTPLSLMFGDQYGRQMVTPGQRLPGAVGAALSIIPIPGIAKGAGKVAAHVVEDAAAHGVERNVAQDAVQAVSPIVAYHGSPHQFDQFDLSKIGTGEGAQAYGHGLYLAENENTAQAYRKALSGVRPDFDGKLAPELVQKLGTVDYLGFDSPGQALSAIRQHPDWASRWDVSPKEAADLQPLIDAHEERKYGGQGHMYQVGINADPNSFLDWDKGLHQQTPQVQQALQAFGIKADPEGMKAHTDALLAALSPEGDAGAAIHKAPWDPSGGAIYESSKIVPGGYRDPAAATQALQQAGIPGIKYKDQGSRGADGASGTHNYVVFNAKIIDIMKRYGLPFGMAATLATHLMAGQSPASQPAV